MRNYIRHRGLDPLLAERNGWYPSTSAGDEIPRIVIPASNGSNFPYWQARAMRPTEKRYQSPRGSREDSIVVCWPETKQPWAFKTVVIVEGPFDALAAADVGYIGVAVMGASPPDRVWDVICSWFIPPFLIVPDSDGLAAGVEWVRQLATRGKETCLKPLTGAKDLAGLVKDVRELVLA